MAYRGSLPKSGRCSQPRCCLSNLRAAESTKADELSSLADQALKAAEAAREAEERAALLRQSTNFLKAKKEEETRNELSVAGKSSDMKLIEEDKLAKEMSELLSSLQKPMRGGARDPLSEVRRSWM
jgi:hypothetical protein